MCKDFIDPMNEHADNIHYFDKMLEEDPNNVFVQVRKLHYQVHGDRAKSKEFAAGVFRTYGEMLVSKLEEDDFLLAAEEVRGMIHS